MPAPIIVVGIGMGLGVIGGYITEKTVGDGHYSGTDMAIDAGVGALGGGVVGPVAKMTGRATIGMARYANRVRKFGKHSDEAVDAMIYTAGALTRPAYVRPVGITAIGEFTKVGINTLSSGSRSERNGPNVGPGGKNRSKTVPPSVRGVALKNLLRKEGYGKVARDVCPKGYKLVRTKTGFVCQLK